MAYVLALRRSARLRVQSSIRNCWLKPTSPLRNLSFVRHFNRSFSARRLPIGFRHFRTTSIAADNEILIVKTPPFAESITEGDIRWNDGIGPGKAVEEDEQLADIETDKTTIPLSSPKRGVILELLVENESTVTAGQDLCKLEVGAGAPAASTTSPPAPSVKEEAKEPVAVKVDVPTPESMPSAPPLPSGPMAVVTPTPVPDLGSSLPVSHSASTRGEKRVKMSRMRLRIAERLKSAQNTCAMLTTFNEVDMSNIIEMRNQHKETFFKKHGIKLGFMSAFVKASAFALQDQPVVNAVIDGNEIIYRDYVDISVAIASPKGLLVPVLRNCETMNFADVEKSIYELGVKARDGTMAVEDMDGGTFTISNGGVFGSLYGTPIINPPQSAILGMHAIVDRPMAVKGQVVIRPMMYLALTYDHRLVDGREAVTFLRKIKSAIEDPRVLLLDV